MWESITVKCGRSYHRGVRHVRENSNREITQHLVIQLIWNTNNISRLNLRIEYGKQQWWMILELEVNSSAVRSSTTVLCSYVIVLLDQWLRAVPRQPCKRRRAIQIYGLREKTPRCQCRHARRSRGMLRAVVKDRGSKLGITTYTEKWKDTVLQTLNSIN